MKKLIMLLFFLEITIIAQESPCETFGSEPYHLSGYSWDKSELKYYFHNFTSDSDLTQAQIRQVFQDAFNKWGTVTGLTFNETSILSEADITMKWHTAGAFYNSTYYYALTWQPPPFHDEKSGDIEFNENITWKITKVGNGWSDLRYVALHEIGHALGLCHSGTQSAVMYYPLDHKLELTQDDIDGINAIYVKVRVKNNFRNPDGSISNGGIINVENVDYNTNNEPNNEKILTFNNDSERRFEAKEQNFNGIDRKFNSNSDYSGGWIFNNNLVGLTSILNVDVSEGTYTANYKYKTNIGLEAVTEFDDIISVGTISNIFQYESESIQAIDPYKPNNITYNFAYWTDDLLESNPRTITPTENETYTAFYKYLNHTTEAAELDRVSQTKIIRPLDNYLYKVYESKDHIWFEKSTNNGSTWLFANSGRPLDDYNGKNPSIDSYLEYERKVIVFQERLYGTNQSGIKVCAFRNGSFQFSDYAWETDVWEQNYFTHNYNPVVGYAINDRIIVVWEDEDCLAYRSGTLSFSNNEISWDSNDIQVIPNTNVDSKNITIASFKTSMGYPSFQVAWEQPTATNRSKINYTTFNVVNNNLTHGNIEEPSLGCGYTKNYSPSIVVLDDGLPRLTWVGERDMEQEENTAKVNGIEAGSTQKRVILRGRNTQGDWNPTIFTYGSNVNKVSMSYNETGTLGGYAFAWTENETAPHNYKHVKNTTLNYSPMQLYSVEGKYLQLCNGDDFSDMYAMGLTETIPYEFNLSENLNYTGGQQEAKVNSGNFTSIGREGIITNGDAEFYFTIKDVLVENTEISFSEVNENTTYSNLSEFNSYLSTEPFELNNNSSFLYTVQHGLIEKDSIISPLGEGKFINFKVQLIDAVSNDLIGEFDNVTYTDDDIYQYANIGYQVNTQGIGERTVKLKLVVDYNINPVYSLSTLYTEENLLAKRGLHQIGFEGSLEVKEYQLAQNYPNPFNPSTTINYQIPQDGAVKLVIYDALGREVRTLVNEFKTKGRYEAVFNANDLASGVYIYHLKVNDFVQTRKMMLLK